jgi:ribosomal protein S18 acetylase RimI-like enzyme
MGITIRRLRESEWPALRELRLASLRTDPLAFGSTLESEQDLPDGRWRESAVRGSSGDREVTFVATDPTDRFVGMCGALSEQDEFIVLGMWVDPEQRARGTGSQLLGAVLGWIERGFPRSTIVLDVNPAQAGAVRMYRKHGFAFEGAERPLGHHPPAMRRRMVRRPHPP